MGCRTRSSQNTGIAGMGGSDPCLDFCEGFVHMHWGPSKVIIHHPKVIIFPTKVFLFPRNHINLTFSLSKMIYALLSKNGASRNYTLLWAKFARMPGLGGVNPILWNARILGPYSPPTPPLRRCNVNVSSIVIKYLIFSSILNIDMLFNQRTI